MKKCFVVLLTLLVLVGCGSSGKGNDKPKELSDTEIASKLIEISNWYISDYWNKGLVEIVSYTASGTSATGGELDMELVMKDYNQAIKDLGDKNEFVLSLDGKEKYQDVVDIWKKLHNEMTTIDKVVQGSKIEKNVKLDFSTDLLVQYSNALSDYVYKLNK